MFCIDTNFEFPVVNSFVDKVDNFVDNRIFSTLFLFSYVDRLKAFPLSRKKLGLVPNFPNNFVTFYKNEILKNYYLIFKFSDFFLPLDI